MNCRYQSHRITASAMCSDGAWLNGWSKPRSALNKNAGAPSTGGCPKLKCSGHAMKHVHATSVAVTSRSACRSSVCLLRARNSDSA
jgi:hypothetical protein